MGTPGPNVTFATDYTPLDDISPDNYELTVTRLNLTTTRAEVFIADPDVARMVETFQCSAKNVQSDFGGYPEDYYVMFVNSGFYNQSDVAFV